MTTTTKAQTRMETVMTEIAPMLILNKAPDAVERHGQSPEAAAQMSVDRPIRLGKTCEDGQLGTTFRSAIAAKTNKSPRLEGATS